jgi:hypothetical protein
VNDELEGMWKEAVVDCFEIGLLSQHLPGGNMENHENLSQDVRPAGQNLNQRPTENEARVVTTRPRRLVTCWYNKKRSEVRHVSLRRQFH